MSKFTTRSRLNQLADRNWIATNPFRKWRSSACAGSSPGEVSIADFLSPREIDQYSEWVYQYSEWDQFVLIDKHGDIESPTTGRRCDPFKKKNQLSMAAVLRATRPGQAFGFVLTKADPFFVIVVCREIRDTPAADAILREFSFARMTQFSRGDILIAGASYNISEHSPESWPPEVELYTEDYVLHWMIVIKMVLEPFAPAADRP